jgi:hypothetical protein
VGEVTTEQHINRDDLQYPVNLTVSMVVYYVILKFIGWFQVLFIVLSVIASVNDIVIVVSANQL